MPSAAADGPAQPAAYLDQAGVAARYFLSERTLERWRSTGDGPKFVRIGPRRVLYRLADCEEWALARTFEHRAAEVAARPVDERRGAAGRSGRNVALRQSVKSNRRGR